ncbi:hypothetical protein L228DRAFT_251141 [Xylona heveae TC161]|uniref:Serine hydrolase domain-containing protein n=1 Tax=Xylona heveae (strain CBS 132557 / TC161) TaxID=1328760 RepID=A0A164ZU77_XYLHT|nr:hypothetical protein L228DRAFT_251141 [Xylona heveae TC161]KZF19524.1 hypothetical protein L228DRAFT_251141 [Xylona heveae TC161]
MDMLNPDDVDSAEREILQIAAEEGPFDGILGYSQGATLAAQVLIRYANENPFAAVDEMPFRFAVFINGATPGGLFALPDSEKPPQRVPLENIPEAALLFSVMKTTAGTTRLWPGRLSDGRGILTDGEVGMKLWNVDLDGIQIHVPTLHVRCLDDKSDYGEGLEKLCEPTLMSNYYHNNGHDFPRGNNELSTIAQLIRTTAERAL